MIVTHIVAMAENRVIGREGDLPWRIPEDFKFFKRVTMGHALIMGRKTYESIGRPLPGRHTIVVTRDPSFRPEGVNVVSSPAEALALAESRVAEWGEEVFVAGGGEIYRQTLPRADKVLLTLVHREVTGDVTYPELPESLREVAREDHLTGEWPFSWITYERV